MENDMSKYEVYPKQRSKQDICKYNGEVALFNVENNQRVSQWWEKINPFRLDTEESEYYIAENKQGKQAIFHIDNPSQPISQWWDDITIFGLVAGESEYYIAQNENKQFAIFHKDNPNKPVSQWWRHIEQKGLITGHSNYYIAKNQNNQYAIFHKDNPNEPITQWWRSISSEGIIEGKSKYYIAVNQKGEQAIFHVDNPHQPASQWWKNIDEYNGLIKNQSKYYIAEDRDDLKAIFHINNPDEPISQWWVHIYSDGLVNNQSEYYIALNQEDKLAIFHVSNPDKPVSNWHKYISPVGLVSNISQCYATRDDDTSPVYVYHISDIWQPLYELPDEAWHELLYLNEDFAIYISDQYIKMYDSIQMKSNIIGQLTEDTQIFLDDMKYRVDPTYIDATVTSQLIHQYIDNEFLQFLPIIIHNIIDEEPYRPCFLYTLNGEYIATFNSLNELCNYMNKHTKNKNKDNSLSCDIIRLY